MKLFLFGNHSKQIRPYLHEAGFTVTTSPDRADLIFVYGGDGAMLQAAAEFPDRLIFPMRDVETAPLCPKHEIRKQLALLAAGRMKRTDLPRLCGRVGKKTLTGINDIFIHNKIMVSAIRYDVYIDSELYRREIIGDSIGISTVHGSTAYYRNITHSIFRTGLGLVFSNSTEFVNHLVLPETSRIRIHILRGSCEMTADNLARTIPLAEGDEIEIALTDKTTSILGVDEFMCPECRQMRHDLRRTLISGKKSSK